MRKRILSLVAILTLAAGCADFSAEEAAPARFKSKSAEGDIAQLAAYPVIVRVAGRNQNIVVHAGPNGPLVTVTDGQGREVVSGITMAELKERLPLVHRQLNGTADAVELDASIGLAGE